MTKSTFMSHSLAVAILANGLIGTSAAQESGASTSVTRELEKLFNESGRSMPSMKTQDLPYATTPELDRVREKSADTPAPRFKMPGMPPLPTLRNSTKSTSSGRKPGLLGRVFGRFSRKAAEPESVSPPAAAEPFGVPSSASDPPAIVYGPYRTQTSPADVEAPSTSAVQSHAGSPAGDSVPVVRAPARAASMSQPVDVDPWTVEEPATRLPVTVVSSPREKSTREGGNQSSVPLLSEQSHQPDSVAPPVNEAEPVELDFSKSGSDSDFSSPFAKEEPLYEGESLDLDNVVDVFAAAPVDVVDPVTRHWADGIGEDDHVGDAQESSPFTGLRIDADDDESIPARESIEFGDVEPFEDSFTDSDEESFADPIDESPATSTEESEFDTRSDWRHSLIESRRTERIEAVRNNFRAAPLGAADSYRMRGEYQEQLRARRHLTGFMGFCPVALRDRQELVDAAEEFRVQFGLNTYDFSSAEAKAEFEKNPTRYVPVVGGADVVALMNSGEGQPGSLQFSRWHRDRLYLFQSRETMALFSLDPDRFANEY